MIYRKYSFYGGYCLILPEFWCACDRKIMAKALDLNIISYICSVSLTLTSLWMMRVGRDAYT